MPCTKRWSIAYFTVDGMLFRVEKLTFQKKIITEKIVQTIVKFNPMASQMFVTFEKPLGTI